MADRVQAVIQTSRVIAIVREKSATAALDQAKRLIKLGAQAIEVSLSTPGAIEVIAEINHQLPSNTANAAAGIQCGAGTVVTVRQVADVARAGAAFAVSPLWSPELVHAAVDAGLVGVFGAFTPAECYQAARAGSHFVKLFPASQWTPAGVRDLLQALPELRLVPTGGVTLPQARQWLAAGATAVGLGSALSAEPSDGVVRQAFLDLAEGTTRT